jgi:hypothetical protein
MASNAVFPTEIWADIRSYLPLISKHVIADALRLNHSPKSKRTPAWSSREDKHSRVWNSIFQNENWFSVIIEKGLNPVLIGHDLHYIYHAKNIRPKTKSKYLVLVLGYNGNGGKHNKPYVTDEMNLLIDSLMPHTRLESGERFFPETGITVNIRDAMYDFHYTTITQPRRLVSRKVGGLYSAYLYWNDDSFQVRTIGPKHIIGIGGALTKKNVSNIVGLEWEHLPGKKLRQHFFEIAGMEIKTNQIDNGKRGPSFKVTGWKWKDEWIVMTKSGWKSNVAGRVKKDPK